MFFILSKIFAFVISPINWITTFLLFSFFLKNQQLKKRFLAIGIVALFLFSNLFIFDECMRLWEHPGVHIDELDTCDIGIVLGGMVSYDESFDRVQFSSSVNRLIQSIELYRKGKIKKIFFLGGSGSILYPHHREGPLVKRYLLMMGIPEADIMIESESRNTYENAIFSKKIIEEKNIKGKFLLITSGYHIKRALACFEKAGLKTIPYSSDRYSGPRRFEFDHLFIPNAATLFSWNAFIHEIVGYITYYFTGYL